MARIKLGLRDSLAFGNLSARRDWGHARDYVKAMWLMLQHEQPEDYVVATGRTTSVQEFCELAFARVGLEARNYVHVESRYLRPREVDVPVGNPAKAQPKLGWRAEIGLEQLVAEMDADLQRVRKGQHL